VKTVLILGAGVMQMPGIRIARRKGWRVIVADGNPEAVARDLGDRFEVIDLKDREGLLALARGYAGGSGLDGVFTAGTDFSSSVAWVAEKLGLPGIPYAAAMRATDKCLMRAAFDAHGVPSPRYACWAGEGDPSDILSSELEFPLVVKPVDNMGARGVRRVDDRDGLVEACRAALPLSRSSRVIVEQFMEGPELSLDAVAHNGRVTVCGVADRHIAFPPSFVEMGHTMPTELDAATVRGIEEVFVAGMRAIGIDSGAAKGDIKLTPRGPMAGEIAARLSGGYMSGWTFPLASGVEVTEAALNIAVGLEPGDLTPKWRRTCAERAVISIPGRVERIEGFEEARGLPGVEEVFLRVAPGEEVVFPANNVQKCGNVIAVGDVRSEAAEAARRAISLLRIRLSPLVKSTAQHLARGPGNDAFATAGSGIREKIGSMPRFRGAPSAALGSGEPVLIEPLEGWEDATHADWYGIAFHDAVHLALRAGGGRMGGHPGQSRFMLSGLFWRAMVRGTTQGGIWVLDSLREAARRGATGELLAGP
jgi:biotin carboxylase